MHVHIALAQFRPTKGDPAASMERVSGCFERLKALPESPDLVLFPETATTGYFLEGGVREHAVSAPEMVEHIQRAWKDAAGGHDPIDVCIGFYETHDGRLYNSALYAELGPDRPRLVHVHRKVFLPTYGVFQEERFVEPGDSIQAFDTRWGRAAILVCEDLWYAISAETAVRDGAQLLLVPSASPARGTAPGPGIPGNLVRWTNLAGGAGFAEGREFTDNGVATILPCSGRSGRLISG